MDTLTQKEQLEIYTMAKEEMKLVESRLDNVLEKASHQLTILAIILAFASVGLGTFVDKLAVWRASDFFEVLFLSFYGLLLVLVFGALFRWMSLLRTENFETVEVSDGLINFFKKLRYEKAIQRLVSDYMRYISENEKCLAKKNEKMENGRRFLIFIVVLTIITTILYITVQVKDYSWQKNVPQPQAVNQESLLKGISRNGVDHRRLLQRLRLMYLQNSRDHQ